MNLHFYFYNLFSKSSLFVLSAGSSPGGAGQAGRVPGRGDPLPGMDLTHHRHLHHLPGENRCFTFRFSGKVIKKHLLFYHLYNQ